MLQLTDRDREILAFETLWRGHSGAKEDAIRETFGLNGARYYQLLNKLIDDPAALAVDPLLVKALLRARARRGKYREARAFAP